MERLQQQCIIDANLEDLVTCHECGYKVCVPKNNQYYICECGKKNCRKCPRLFDHKHFGKTCQQMDQEEANNVILRNLESKISEVVIRKCQKCGISFVKNEGCNKMECRCGAKQCYICGKQDIEHSHFCW
uniref:RING-type domain-containing protein n=1 Tax=Panagrolaimus superbus TaxID=310955 RepID=A0A914YNZ5_9BILA